MGANLTNILKWIGCGAALLLASPLAVLAGFGLFNAGFAFFAQTLSLAPGTPGRYVRVAYYARTWRSCSLESYIGIGSFFAHPKTSVGHRVYIGALCVLGQTNIGDRTQIASGVQILSGRRQHGRRNGRIEGSEGGVFEAGEVPPEKIRVSLKYSLSSYLER
jgi:hypothetical protein